VPPSSRSIAWSWGDRSPGNLEPWQKLRTDNWLSASAYSHPDKEAVRFEGRSLSYRELDRLASRAAHGIRNLGAREGDVVALMAENSPETFALMYGIARAGVAVLPLNPRYTAAEVEFQLADASAKFLVAKDAVPIEDVFACGSDDPCEYDFDENAFFHVRFTGGTTGRAKAVATTHRAMALGHLRWAREQSCTTCDVALVVAPLAHVAFHVAATFIVAGATIILKRSFDAASLWSDIEREGITHIFAVPTMLAMAMETPGTASSLRQLVVTATAFPPALRARFEARFPHVEIFETYGASDLAQCTMARPTDPPDKKGSVGRAAFGCSVRILDPHGHDMQPGEIGEIYARGATMSYGYVGSVGPMPMQSREGWVTVGDLGYRDNDGYVYVVDRRDDLIVSGGLNVYPSEVEDVLLAHPALSEAAVVAVSDEVWGHVVAAAVRTTATREELEAHCRARLAGYKIPRRWWFVEELPKSAANKVLRRVVRAGFENGEA
jgi:long-chain acyl-CoA synthetase